MEEEVGEDVEAGEEVEDRYPELNSRTIRPELDKSLELQDTKVPNIQTFQLEPGQGARCIISGGKVLSSVQSHLHVLGRMCSVQSQANEKPTNSRKM